MSSWAFPRLVNVQVDAEQEERPENGRERGRADLSDRVYLRPSLSFSAWGEPGPLGADRRRSARAASGGRLGQSASCFARS
jgi:hypothetical protein